MTPKTVTIQLAIFNGYNQPLRMVDWEAILTQIPGHILVSGKSKLVFLTKPAGMSLIKAGGLSLL